MKETEVYNILSAYHSARDFFAATQNAAQEIQAARLTLERLHVRELPHAQSYAPRITGGKVELLNATDVRMMVEERTRKTVEEDTRLVEACTALLYGVQGGQQRGGLVTLVGVQTCDVVFQRVVQLRKWFVVARTCCMSLSWCKLQYNVACESVDAYGWQACVQGKVKEEQAF